MAIFLAGGLWYAFARDDGAGLGAAKPGSSPAGSTEPRPPHLMALALTGTPQPYLAVIGVNGAGGHPVAIPTPPELTLIVPGQGETTTADLAGLSGTTIQVALSNEVGVWVDEMAVLDVGELADVVNRAGGLRMNLPEVFPTATGSLGPGDVTLGGAQVAELLMLGRNDSALRWEVVLTGLLKDPPTLARTDLEETSSVSGVQEILDAAQGGEVLPLPTKDVAGAAVVAAQPALDDIVAVAFGTEPPTPAIVQNGSGAPGVGEEVARRIIPAGFRVVLSQNAQSFDLPATDIIANGVENAGDARRARRALGVGRVGASRVPSGIGDITIVVGKDFQA